MDNLTLESQTFTSAPPAAPSYLQQLAATMKRRALERPNAPIYPSRPLQHGAQIVLWWDTQQFHLRIARHGLAPWNLINADGEKKLKAWRREIHTFCRDFGFTAHPPDGAGDCDGTQELIYYVDLYFTDPTVVELTKEFSHV